MNKIISKEHFSEKVFKLVIEAPLIAKSRRQGTLSLYVWAKKANVCRLPLRKPTR